MGRASDPGLYFRFTPAAGLLLAGNWKLVPRQFGKKPSYRPVSARPPATFFAEPGQLRALLGGLGGQWLTDVRWRAREFGARRDGWYQRGHPDVAAPSAACLAPTPPCGPFCPAGVDMLISNP